METVCGTTYIQNSLHISMRLCQKAVVVESNCLRSMAALTPVSSSTTCMTVHCMYLDGLRTHPVHIGDRTAHVIVMRSQMQREEKTLLISLVCHDRCSRSRHGASSLSKLIAQASSHITYAATQAPSSCQNPPAVSGQQGRNPGRQPQNDVQARRRKGWGLASLLRGLCLLHIHNLVAG